ncbi:DUF3703 domain-containing protein [Lacibacter sediminis]|uniref:DUF3703 domain-containing protein n=1 Tax=Lacibacter sediminis TaxID=2760713 RepID=A0A7G5XBT0_9BACT|nr:DUF3703 domain-containing protein [Lacibacter sediminis]QNA42933.1 DUF3703 domain-containing protein [Lacibacter sediminis]
MNLNTSMPKSLKPYFLKELNEYKTAVRRNDLQMAWRHLEKAHVIGQAYPFEHSYVHWKMFLFGIKIKDGKEIVGQIPRLLVGGVKSFVGKIPVGNTGGANVPPLKPLPIEEEIAEIFRKAGLSVPG